MRRSGRPYGTMTAHLADQCWTQTNDMSDVGLLTVKREHALERLLELLEICVPQWTLSKKKFAY